MAINRRKICKNVKILWWLNFVLWFDVTVGRNFMITERCDLLNESVVTRTQAWKNFVLFSQSLKYELSRATNVCITPNTHTHKYIYLSLDYHDCFIACNTNNNENAYNFMYWSESRAFDVVRRCCLIEDAIHLRLNQKLVNSNANKLM